MLALLKAATYLTANAAANDLDVGDAVNGVVQISDAISRNGPVIVICSVFIVLFILIFLLFLKLNNTMLNNIINQMNKKSDESAELNKKMYDYFMRDSSENDDEKEDHKDTKSEKSHSKDLVGLSIDYNATFKKESRALFNSIPICDRIGIYVFHNGNKALYGLPFIKMSCVYDSTIMGTSSMRGRTHINLPLHLFNDLMESLYHDGEFAGGLESDKIHDGSVREFLSFSDNKSMYMGAIKKEDGALAGFTVCEFDDNVDFSNKEFYDKVKYTVKDMNSAIKYIITNEQFSKKLENND